MKKILGIMGVVGLLFAGCSSEDDILSAFHSDPNAVRITAEVGKASANGFTRSYPLGDAEAQKKFKEGDMISVQADGQDAVNYQLVGTEWQPQVGKFLKWESDEMNFTAYYPASFDGNLNNITLPAEYDAASLAANDFMSYSGKQSNTKGNQLSLIMERKMARVVVEIDGFNDQYAEATVNSLSICGIKAYKHSDNKFYALIKPCTESSAIFLSLDVAEGESKTTTETLTGIPALAAGNSYTYKLKVGKNKISVSGITVANWTSGEITGGKAEEKYISYVTFTAKDPQTFQMTEHGDYKISGLEYSVNNGKWTAINASTVVTFGGAKGDLRLRGTKNATGTATDGKNYSKITFTNKAVNVSCTGDIRTLLDWENYTTVKTENARFCYLFDKCAVLTSAPKLPAETLADNCYLCMFSRCTSLKTAPELPAETLTKKCYNGMFFKCESLQTAPKLPAKTLADNCYYTMFKGCTNLEKAPELEATQLAYYCCSDMFNGCTNLKTAPILKAETLAEGCYYNMFNGCTNLKTAPELPAKTLTKKCYNGMFLGCQSLTSTPELKAEKLAEYCYSEMFKGCTSLNSAQELKATTLAEGCYNAMFNGCINLEKAPELEAITLANFCYMDMFNGCKKLSTVTMLAPSIQIRQKDFCCIGWLQNAGTSATSHKLKLLDKNAYDATKAKLPTIWQIGNCTVLDKAGNAITEQ